MSFSLQQQKRVHFLFPRLPTTHFIRTGHTTHQFATLMDPLAIKSIRVQLLCKLIQNKRERELHKLSGQVLRTRRMLRDGI